MKVFQATLIHLTGLLVHHQGEKVSVKKYSLEEETTEDHSFRQCWLYLKAIQKLALYSFAVLTSGNLKRSVVVVGYSITQEPEL